MTPRPCVIALIGFMGSGKSTAGRRLADRLGARFIDADDAVEASSGRSIRAIFDQDGEAAFRDLERTTIDRLLTGSQAAVLALGGGAAMDPRTRARLAERAVVVHLRISLEAALHRVGNDAGRPVLARPDLADVHAARMATYDSIADIAVEVGDRDIDEVVTAVARTLENIDEAEGSSRE